MKRPKRTVLIVEDNKALLTVLGESFKDAGFQVIKAQNGEEGLMRAMGHRPDIIILDVIMPKANGLQMLIRLRLHKEWGHTVPVILLTDFNTQDEKITGVSQFDPYFIKSNVSMKEVVEKARELLHLGKLKRKYSEKPVSKLVRRAA